MKSAHFGDGVHAHRHRRRDPGGGGVRTVSDESWSEYLETVVRERPTGRTSTALAARWASDLARAGRRRSGRRRGGGGNEEELGRDRRVRGRATRRRTGRSRRTRAPRGRESERTEPPEPPDAPVVFTAYAITGPVETAPLAAALEGVSARLRPRRGPADTRQPHRLDGGSAGDGGSYVALMA